MRVLVFEQWCGGHYFNYLRCLLPRLSGLVDEVIVALTREAMRSKDFELTLSSLQLLPNVRFDDRINPADPSLPARERFGLLRNLVDTVRRTRPHYLLVPSADAQTLAMGLLGHVGIDVLPANVTSEATFHYGYGPAIASREHVVKEAVYRFMYSGCTWTRLNFVSFLYYEHLIARRVAWSKRAHLVPDPVPRAPRLTRQAARRLLGIPEDGRYLGLLGSLDARKAIPELLAGFRAAKLGPKDRLLLAGRLDPRYRVLIDSDYCDLIANGRLVVLDRFLSEEELLQGYGALDLVCATYRDFPGLASLLLKGLASGRPILTRNFGWSAALVKRFGVGWVTDIFEIDSLAKALTAGLDGSSAYVESEATKRLLDFHDPENFTDTMLDQIRRTVGKSPPTLTRSWDWVLEALDPEQRTVS
jgi:glycosyltransferase involved in cell wall biosynthesis